MTSSLALVNKMSSPDQSHLIGSFTINCSHLQPNPHNFLNQKTNHKQRLKQKLLEFGFISEKTRSKIYRCDSDLVAIDSNDSNNANDSNDQIITFNSPFNGKYLHRLFYGLFNGLQPLCDYFCSGRSNSRLVSHTSLFKFSDKSNLVINQLWSLIGFNHQSTLVMN